MTYTEIERFKTTLTNLMKYGCTFKAPGYGVGGRIIGIGFKPYWTSPVDSKIEKLEINFLDAMGRVVPFNIYHITGFDVIAKDAHRLEYSKNISLDIHIYSPSKAREKEPYEKMRMEISVTQDK